MKKVTEGGGNGTLRKIYKIAEMKKKGGPVCERELFGHGTICWGED